MTDINDLYEKVRHSYEYDCRKHDLAKDAEQFATDKINEMTNNELLQAISWALAELVR
jgi:hypothetical protein